MAKVFLLVWIVFGCSQQSTSVVQPTTTRANEPVVAPEDTRPEDDLCRVLDRVRADAPSRFRAIRGAEKKQPGSWDSQLRPSGALDAEIQDQPSDHVLFWNATYNTGEPGTPTLDDIVSRVERCNFGHGSRRKSWSGAATENLAEWIVSGVKIDVIGSDVAIVVQVIAQI